jgi:hypothetical protein
MAAAKNRMTHKHFRLDSTKIKLAQKALQAATETATIDRALDLVISEHERNALTAEANRKFLRSRIVIRDVYGKLHSHSMVPGGLDVMS